MQCGDNSVDRKFDLKTAGTGEVAVATDAVALLSSLAESRLVPVLYCAEWLKRLSSSRCRAEQLCKSGHLLEELGKIRIQQMIPGARKALLRSLVLIGAATENNAVQERMYLMVRSAIVIILPLPMAGICLGAGPSSEAVSMAVRCENGICRDGIVSFGRPRLLLWGGQWSTDAQLAVLVW